jgi:hypothetical protein
MGKKVDLKVGQNNQTMLTGCRADHRRILSTGQVNLTFIDVNNLT